MFFYSFIFACGKNLCCARRKRSSALSDSLCKNECVSVSLDSFYYLSCKVLNSASIKYDDERVLFLFKRLGDWNKIWDRLSVIRSRIPVENNDALCNQASRSYFAFLRSSTRLSENISIWWTFRINAIYEIHQSIILYFYQKLDTLYAII